MSNEGRTAIRDKMVDILSASTALKAVGGGGILKVIYKDTPFELPIGDLGCIEVIIEGEAPAEDAEATGGYFRQNYFGTMLVTILQQDITTAYEVETTGFIVKEVPSYAVLAEIVALIKNIFRTGSNRSLQDLTYSNGNVWTIEIDKTVEYGAARRDERDNNLENFVMIPFTVQTEEVET